MNRVTYDTAKKLKDAGFPQNGESGQYSLIVGKINPNCLIPGDVFGVSNENSCYVPSLEELIEACGHKFKGISKHFKKAIDPVNVWEAKARLRPGVFVKYWGSTPSEAVANLWLGMQVTKSHEEALIAS